MPFEAYFWKSNFSWISACKSIFMVLETQRCWKLWNFAFLRKFMNKQLYLNFSLKIIFYDPQDSAVLKNVKLSLFTQIHEIAIFLDVSLKIIFHGSRYTARLKMLTNCVFRPIFEKATFLEFQLENHFWWSSRLCGAKKWETLRFQANVWKGNFSWISAWKSFFMFLETLLC